MLDLFHIIRSSSSIWQMQSCVTSFVRLRTVEVNEQDSHELTAPLQYFVEVGTFTQVSGAAPAEGTVITKKFQGQTLAGDAWIPIM